MSKRTNERNALKILDSSVKTWRIMYKRDNEILEVSANLTKATKRT